MSILTIARLTFREAVRRKIALTAILLGVAFLVIFHIGFHFVTTDPDIMPARIDVRREMVNFMSLAGFYAVNFLAVAMAALVSIDTLAGEISSGTMQSLAAKPLRRAEIVLGKWLGFAGLLFLYVLLMAGGVALGAWLQSAYLPPNLVGGLLLIYLESLVMMTISVACSSSLSTLASGGVVFGLFGIAFVGGWVEQIGEMLKSQTAVQIGILTSLLMPTEALWRRAAALMTSPLLSLAGNFTPLSFFSSSIPSPLMVWYAIVFLAAALAIALLRFNKRDL